MSKSPKQPAQSPAPHALSFEDALEQVESIIERIERGEIGLEQSLAEYERGVKLIQHCRHLHKHAVQRVDELTHRLTEGSPTPPTPGTPDDEDAEP